MKMSVNQQIFSEAYQAQVYQDTGLIIGPKNTFISNPDQGATPSPGATQVYRLNPSTHGRAVITGIFLENYVQASVTVGTSGSITSLNLVPYFGAVQIQSLEVWTNGLMISKIDDLDILTKTFAYNDYSEFLILRDQLGATPTTSLATPTPINTFRLDLSQYVGIFSQPFPLWLLNSDLEIRIVYALGTLPNGGSFVQYSGTALSNPAITYVQPSQLYVTYQTIGAELGAIMSKNPVDIMDYQSLRIPLQITNGSLNQQFLLSQLNSNNVIILWLVARLQSDLTNSSGAPTFTNFQIIPSYSLVSQGVRITGKHFDITTGYFNNIMLAEDNYPGMRQLYNSNLYAINYSSDVSASFAEGKNSYSGARSFMDISDANLQITYTIAPPNQNIDVVASVMRLWRIEKDGTVVQVPVY
jgi:hypothetical protein